MLDWTKLLNKSRFSELYGRPKVKGLPDKPSYIDREFRLPAERDNDRILFSTPLRHMGDKTQVFPLESIESIHNRLTHSYEVSNLARSIGLEIAVRMKRKLPKDSIRIIPATLAAAGLAHDIGNPPFGHQGEAAIRSWFLQNAQNLFDVQWHYSDEINRDLFELTDQHKNDFLHFEGNAQSLRVLTKLQVIGDDLGLNLTMATLASLMKYVAKSNELDDKVQAKKKIGYFTSECYIAERLRQETGLENEARHPLALIMEACDDMAYLVIDAEDAVKKKLVSFNDLVAWLRQSETDETLDYLCKVLDEEYKQLDNLRIVPGERNNVAMQKFRVHAIHALVAATVEAFFKNYKSIMKGTFDSQLLKESHCAKFCHSLRVFDRTHAYADQSVREIELEGYNIICDLLDFLWIGISEREIYEDLESPRSSPFSAYIYSRISRNYRRVFEGKVESYHSTPSLPIRYRELQLLTDMISGMTDQFCMDLRKDIKLRRPQTS
ncbi:MAG: dNTP triphosphohydrolase [Defluviicoccus sp.]|nr:dNTP triphosphohydrolase [Defluviicoccus sp.]MDE0276161.1 dNTP triphosphohydrolase [Defluviicoccus sp.]